MAEHQELPDRERGEGILDLLGLAMALIGSTDIESVFETTLLFLRDMRRRAGWAVLFQVSPGRYECDLAGRIGEADLRRMAAEACGPDALLSVGAARTYRRVHGPAVWTAADGNGGDRFVIACWSGHRELEDHELRMLSTAAGIAAAAATAARNVEDLVDRSFRDPLTELLNRRGILDTLNREKARVKRRSRPLSVLFLDLDRFKEINDRYGHAVGDELLREVARRLHSALRLSDAIGRIGGDEFLIVLPDTDRAGASRIGARLARQIGNQPVSTSTGEVRMQISFGSSSVAEDRTGAGLIDRADRRMMTRKRRRSLLPAVPPIAPVEPPAAARAAGNR